MMLWVDRSRSCRLERRTEGAQASAFKCEPTEAFPGGSAGAPTPVKVMSLRVVGEPSLAEAWQPLPTTES